MHDENATRMTVPQDPFCVKNSGKEFTLRQLATATRNKDFITQVAEELGLRSSGPTNNFLRHKMIQYGLFGHSKFATFKHYKPECFPVKDRIVPVPAVEIEPLNFTAEQIGKWKKTNQTEVDQSKLQQAARLTLEALGEDINRDGLKDTPKRYAKYMADIMNGRFMDPDDYLTDFDNDGNYTGPVVVTNMPFYTICEHHLAPFIGTWDFAYKPKDRILGLSKVVRIARVFMKRPQVQERLTQQIAERMYDILNPEWVVIRMGAEHFCMSTRGVRTPGAKTYTRQVIGDEYGDDTSYILTIPEGE